MTAWATAFVLVSCCGQMSEHVYGSFFCCCLLSTLSSAHYRVAGKSCWGNVSVCGGPVGEAESTVRRDPYGGPLAPVRQCGVASYWIALAFDRGRWGRDVGGCGEPDQIGVQFSAALAAGVGRAEMRLPQIPEIQPRPASTSLLTHHSPPTTIPRGQPLQHSTTTATTEPHTLYTTSSPTPSSSDGQEGHPPTRRPRRAVVQLEGAQVGSQSNSSNISSRTEAEA